MNKQKEYEDALKTAKMEKINREKELQYEQIIAKAKSTKEGELKKEIITLNKKKQLEKTTLKTFKPQ